MKAYDFEYDGIRLSDLGYTICSFGKGKGLETVSNGAQISFTTVGTQHGSKNEKVSADYNGCLETTIQVCKNICDDSNMTISIWEFRDLVAWLNREQFLKLKFLCEEYYEIYFEASCNINRIEYNGELIGVEINIQTNRPWALEEPRTIKFKNLQANETRTIIDFSDKEGFIYPDEVTITVNQDGDLSIHNDIEDRTTYIRNCKAGEVITMKYPIIDTSLNSHKIQNDFNWDFLRIANTFRNKENNFTFSLPCIVEIKYSCIVKVGL